MVAGPTSSSPRLLVEPLATAGLTSEADANMLWRTVREASPPGAGYDYGTEPYG